MAAGAGLGPLRAGCGAVHDCVVAALQFERIFKFVQTFGLLASIAACLDFDPAVGMQ